MKCAISYAKCIVSVLYFADIILSVFDVEAVLIILNLHVISATIFQKSNQECHFVMAPLIPNVFQK